MMLPNPGMKAETVQTCVFAGSVIVNHMYFSSQVADWLHQIKFTLGVNN
jgi:hypothetical protein